MRLDHLQLAIPSGSEDANRAFWTGILDCAEMEKPEQLKSRGGVWFLLDGAEVHLGIETDFRPAKKAHPALLVTNIDNLADRLTAAGYAVQWDESIAGRRRFFTHDPVGNRIEFIGET